MKRFLTRRREKVRQATLTTEQNLTRVGDTLQSASSRMAAHITGQMHAHNHGVPYEVSMAALEADRAVADWTALRRKMGAAA